MIFDISTKESAMQFLCDFTGLSINSICDFLEQNTIIDGCCIDTTSATAENLMTQSGIDFDSLDTTAVKAKVTHYTSNNDNCETIRKIGLGDLQFAVSRDTPLKRFLEKNDISIFPDTHLLKYKEQLFDISYTRYDSDNPVTQVAHKMYYDNQISCFFRIIDISRYGGHVDKRPEILFNLDTLFKSLSLSRSWVEQSKSYEVSFLAPLSDFELFTFYDHRQTPYYDNEKMAEAIIEKALGVASAADSDELFAYMKPSIVISPNQIISIKEI
ncbi:hypothetical protein [[Clostridium] scindens]|uniref:hypothetical protein n=1 Tax=Clostridium scindens (strain JCM 10418 / VPI 12708) TaxID=29347 RepID=UPI0022DF295E|nr:hypothetical protein [[Clostridium] scindens]